MVDRRLADARVIRKDALRENIFRKPHPALGLADRRFKIPIEDRVIPPDALRHEGGTGELTHPVKEHAVGLRIPCTVLDDGGVNEGPFLLGNMVLPHEIAENHLRDRIPVFLRQGFNKAGIEACDLDFPLDCLVKPRETLLVSRGKPDEQPYNGCQDRIPVIQFEGSFKDP